MGPSADIQRERCEGEAAADCSASAQPLLETFLASVGYSLCLEISMNSTALLESTDVFTKRNEQVP